MRWPYAASLCALVFACVCACITRCGPTKIASTLDAPQSVLLRGFHIRFEPIRRLCCRVETAKLKPDFFFCHWCCSRSQTMNMCLFRTLQGPEIMSDIGAHLSMPFDCDDGPLQRKGIDRCARRSDMISGSCKVQNSYLYCREGRVPAILDAPCLVIRALLYVNVRYCTWV